MPNITVVDRELFIKFYVEWDDEVITVTYTENDGFHDGFHYDEADLGDIDRVDFADFLIDSVVIKSSIKVKEVL